MNSQRTGGESKSTEGLTSPETGGSSENQAPHRSLYSLLTLALGVGIGAAMTAFVNALQHVKVTEPYKANLVTSEGNKREHVPRCGAPRRRDLVGFKDSDQYNQECVENPRKIRALLGEAK